MLGKALVNSSGTSTGGDKFKPQEIQLDTWHIGAQYFMVLCDDDDGADEKSMVIIRTLAMMIIGQERR